MIQVQTRTFVKSAVDFFSIHPFPLFRVPLLFISNIMGSYFDTLSSQDESARQTTLKLVKISSLNLDLEHSGTWSQNSDLII